MSDAIRRMLADRATAADAHAAAKRRAIKAAVIEPQKKAYIYGWTLIRAYLAGERRGGAEDALAEGMVMGMMDGFLETAEEGWCFSQSRKDAVAAADAIAEELP